MKDGGKQTNNQPAKDLFKPMIAHISGLGKLF